MTRRVPLTDLRPTQLYLSSQKLAGAMSWFDFDDPNHGTLPAFEYEGERYLSDGHTRAFLAWLAGARELRVERDADVREEYDFGVYETCIEWCEEEGVRTVGDLAGRVVEPKTFEEVWLARCRRVGRESTD